MVSSFVIFMKLICRQFSQSEACPDFSDYAFTGFESRPMPSISTTTSSPAFRKMGGLRAKPTPCGVPVLITSPGSSVIPREMKAMSSRTLKIILSVLESCNVCSVDDAPDRKSLGIRNVFTGDQIRPHRSEGVLALGAHPLAVAALEVACTHVIEAGISGDIFQRVGGRKHSGTCVP